MRRGRATHLLAVATAVAVGTGVAAATAAGDPNRQGERLVSVRWSRDGSRASSPRTIPIVYSYRGFACQYRFHRVRVKGTDKTVTVTVEAHWRAMKVAEFCTTELGGGRATVHLKHDLGTRKLRHAPVDDPG
jgi:hypothetical protein